MAFLSLFICLIFKEWFALVPIGVTAFSSFGLGQILYRILQKKGAKTHLWDAMVIAALGWLFCSIIGAIPIYWIALERLPFVPSENLEIFANPINALFESFSGFTSTGLTLFQSEGSLPYILQWWRSFLQWVGGIGLVVFVLSLTHLNRVGYQLYYAEAHTEQMSSNITKTAHLISMIYFSYTFLAFLLFFLFGMSWWEALNHSFTVISTGGFTLSSENFRIYGPSLQFIAVLMMLMGSISFSLHFQIIRHRNWRMIIKNKQHLLFFACLIIGIFFVICLNLWVKEVAAFNSVIFEWISALTTCGYSTLSLSSFSPMVKLFLIFGMFLGGPTGSTTGGLKMQRILYLFSGFYLRLKSLTEPKEKQITYEYQPLKKPRSQEPPGIDLPKSAKSERLFTAAIFFFLWCFTLLVGWFLFLKWTFQNPLDALFEVTSAMSNVGLTSGLITPELPIGGKMLLMGLMWIGRLEIIPAVVLILSFPLSMRKGK